MAEPERAGDLPMSGADLMARLDESPAPPDPPSSAVHPRKSPPADGAPPSFISSPVLACCPPGTAEASGDPLLQSPLWPVSPVSVHCFYLTWVAPVEIISASPCDAEAKSQESAHIIEPLLCASCWGVRGEGASMMNQTQAWPSMAVWAVDCHGPAFTCLTCVSCPPASPGPRCPEKPTCTSGVGQGLIPCVQNALSLPDPATHGRSSKPVPGPAHEACPALQSRALNLAPLPVWTLL